MTDSGSWTVALQARVDNYEHIEAAIFEMTESLGSVLSQEDVYFDVPNGQLKLRLVNTSRSSQLIFHKKSKQSSSKLKESRITEVENGNSLRKTLELALGEVCVVRTERRIFEKDNITISLDDVEDMGQFVDISVTVTDHDNETEGMQLAKEVLCKLGIDEGNLIPLGYFDTLMQSSESWTSESELCDLKTTDDSDHQSVSSDSAVFGM